MFRPSGKQRRRLARFNTEQIERLYAIISARARYYRWHGDPRGQKTPFTPEVAMQKAFCMVVDSASLSHMAHDPQWVRKVPHIILRPGGR